MIEIGLQSEGDAGFAVLGIGSIDAIFHCVGTMDDDKERFIMSAIGAAKNGEPIFRNQAGMLSSPVAVGCRESSSLNIRYSVMWESVYLLLTVHFTLGAV